MTGRASRLAAAATGACLLAAPTTAAYAGASSRPDLRAAAAPAAGRAAPGVPGTRLFGFAGQQIVESSGLVDLGDVVLTENDSGDDAIVYGVDPATGRTVSRTTYTDPPDAVQDVEALAPGAGGTVWAGDIGDNRQRRDHVAVYRLRPLDGVHLAARYTLRYPDGPHDAETLLVQPRSQRVFVVSKSIFGGTVYAAPRSLVAGSQPNRLRAYARVGGLVTDGSFFPDGRHVVLRTYGTASVYTFPAFRLVGTVRLPRQPAGEAIAVSRSGRVLLSSEGVHAAVLQVRLPAGLTAAPSAPTVRPSPPASPAPDAVRTSPPRSGRQWAAIGLVAAGIAALGLLTLRAARLR